MNDTNPPILTFCDNDSTMEKQQSDIAMHKAEEIWQNLLTEMIKEETDMFQPAHWAWVKKKLYPLTHENVRDFIPQLPAVEKSYQSGYEQGFKDGSNNLDNED